MTIVLETQSRLKTRALSSPLLSTTDFFSWLCQREWKTSDFFYTMKVNFDPELFFGLVKNSGRFKVVNSREGYLSIVKEGYNADDRSHQTTTFDWHTDGIYYNSPPELVIVYCVRPGRGETPTLLADTVKALEKISYFKDEFSKLNFTFITKTLQLHTQSLLRLHPRTMEQVISFCGRGFVSQRGASRENSGSLVDLRTLSSMMTRLYDAVDDSVVLEHYWSKNDLLVFDNRRFVHARVGKEADEERVLYRIWLNTTKRAQQKIID